MNFIKVPLSIKLFTLFFMIIGTINIIIFYTLLNFVESSIKIGLIILIVSFLISFILNLIFLKNFKRNVNYGFFNIFLYLFMAIYFAFFLANVEKLRLVNIDEIFGNIGWNLGFNNIQLYSFIVGALFGLIFIFYLLVFVKFIFYKKRLKKEISEVDEKYLTNKKEGKGVIIGYVIFLFLLIIFYFTYFNIPVKMEKIPDNFFITKLELAEGKEDKVFILSEKLEKLKEVSSLSKEELKEVEIKNYNILKNNYKYNTGAIDYIDSINVIIREINNEDTLFEELNNEQNYGDIISGTRIIFHNILYYNENDDEDKAIKLALDNYKFGNKLIEGDASLLRMLVGVSINRMSIEQLDYIIENYSLSKKNKILIKNILSKNLNVKNIFSNVIKNEYKLNIKYFTRIELEDNFFYKKEDSLIYFKNIFYSISQNEKDYEYYELEYSYGKKYNNPFKRNYIGYKIVNNTHLSSYVGQIEKLYKLSEMKKEFLEKLGK